MPPASASAVNNNNNAALQAAAKAERAERLRGALKDFILKELERKKEEIEAKLEEERLRKEREARERQNDITLEETRGQILKLDQKLTELRNQKHQLLLQLKKVLNEDDNRKKQQQQKDNDLFAMQALQAQQASVPPPQQQVFLSPIRVHHQMPIISKPVSNQPVKRGHSPSPPPHQSYYKSTNYTQPKHDDGRRSSDYPRVIWNKPPTQYQNPGTLFYQPTSNAPPPQPPPDARGAAIIYPAYNVPIRQSFHLELQPNPSAPVPKPDSQSQKPAQVYHINLDQPPISQAPPGVPVSMQSQKPQVTMDKISDRYHVEVKHDGPPGHGPSHQLPDGMVYTPLLQGLSLHPNVMQIAGNPNQAPKSAGSIGSGYAPGRNGPSVHEQQLARQHLLPSQPGQQSQQMHFLRRPF